MESWTLWTNEQLEKLEKLWGKKDIDFICAAIPDKTKSAIISKANRMHMGGMYKIDDYMSASEIARFMQIDTKVVIKWVEKYKLPGCKRTLGTSNGYYMIKFSNLVKWLENNQDRWDSRLVEINSLGQEPTWLKEKRKKDREGLKHKYSKYTKEEDEIIVSLYRAGFTLTEISLRVKRGVRSVRGRINFLRKEGMLYNNYRKAM